MSKDNEVIILHLSDLHRTPGHEVTNNNLWKELRRDINTEFKKTNSILGRNEPRLPEDGKIDLIIVSGDITQKATEAEYDEAANFLSLLVDNLLDGEKNRLILVPGNHDVDWSYSKGAYEEVQKLTPENTSVQENFFRFKFEKTPPNWTLMQRNHDDIYQDRFKAFAKFFSEFYNKEHSFNLKERHNQYTIYNKFTEKLKIVVVGFSSCDLVDHLWYRGAINHEAIINADSKLDELGYSINSGVLRIAVWHHNVLGSPEKSDFMDPQVAMTLAEHGFSLGLHGHIHKAIRSDIFGSYAGLPVVSAGSLCAGSKERPESIPYQYNVIGIDTKQRRAWIHVRKRDDQFSIWKPDKRFGEQQKSWYRINLSASDESDSSVGLCHELASIYSEAAALAGPVDYHDAHQLLRGWIKEHSKKTGKPMKVLNIALDMENTWDFLKNEILAKKWKSPVEWQSLMIDHQAPVLQEWLEQDSEKEIDLDMAKTRESQIKTYDKPNGKPDGWRLQELREKNVIFQCRTYNIPPFMHGFLISDEVLMAAFCLPEEQEHTLKTTPYFIFCKNPDHHTNLDGDVAAKVIEMFSGWFDKHWSSKSGRWVFGEKLHDEGIGQTD